MRRIGVTLFIGILFFSIFAFTNTKTEHTSLTKSEMAKVNWMSFEEAIEKSKTAPRKIFIDIYTDWCGWCKRMDTATFQQAHIAKYLNENYYAVKFDAEDKTDILYKEKNYSFVKNGRRGYHQLAVELTQGRLSFPTIVFLDEKQNLIQPIPGYQDPIMFEQIMTYFGEDFHKRQPWASYQKSYQPMLPREDKKEMIEAIPVKH